jgi:hypothetical protein
MSCFLVAAASSGQQLLVHLTDESGAEWEVPTQAPNAMIQGGYVVRDLLYIIQRDPGDLIEFEEQEVRERRLRPLDLG